MRKSEYDRAVEDYDRAIRLNPTFAIAYEHRANVYSQKGDYERAIQDDTQAIRIDAHLISAVVGRGNAYLNRGEYDLAIQDYGRAIQLDPGNEQVLGNLREARLEKAKQDSARAMSIEKNVPN